MLSQTLVYLYKLLSVLQSFHFNEHRIWDITGKVHLLLR